MTLPTFVGIGVPRAGTTWLHTLLEGHPQVYLPTRRKEVRFFDRHFEHGPDWYEGFFCPPDEAARYAGDRRDLAPIPVRPRVRRSDLEGASFGEAPRHAQASRRSGVLPVRVHPPAAQLPRIVRGVHPNEAESTRDGLLQRVPHEVPPAVPPRPAPPARLRGGGLRRKHGARRSRFLPRRDGGGLPGVDPAGERQQRAEVPLASPAWP